MSKMRKITALVLALVMVMAMSITTFAASITITEDGTGHEYKIYQILTGAVNDAGNGLDDIDWGSSITAPTGTTAAAAFANVDANTTVSLTDTTITIGTATYTLGDPVATITEKPYKATDLDPGYYAIVDVKGKIEGNDDAYSTGIVKVLKDETVAPKSSTPTVDKQVKDEATDAEEGSTDGWGETADHAMYETYQYKLVATLPDDANMAEYEHYYLKFNDSFSAGITYLGNMTVTATNSNGETIVFKTNAVANTDGAGSFYVEIEDLMNYVTTLRGTVVTVTYDACLNKDAVIAPEDDNQNSVDLDYSNNPDWDGTGTPDKGHTGPDYVFTFTYDVQNTKIDGTTEEALADAQFKLYSNADCTSEIALFFDTTKNAYRPAKTGETAATMVSAADGTFNIIGLDAGTYYLKETQAPTGYNDLEAPITIIIGATHAENSDSVSATVTFTTQQNTVNEIANYNGTTLPETGGMGTTMFYLIGALCVIGAGVLLISRKRVAR